MMWTQIILGSVLTAALVIGMGRVADRWSARPAQAQEVSTAQADGRYWSGLGHRWRHRGEGWGLAGGWCGADWAAMEGWDGYIASALSLTDEQTKAWVRLRAAMQSTRPTLEQACAAPVSDALATGTTMARAESMLTAGLDAVRQVRPAFEAFYAVLNDDQRRTLDERRGRRRWH